MNTSCGENEQIMVYTYSSASGGVLGLTNDWSKTCSPCGRHTQDI